MRSAPQNGDARNNQSTFFRPLTNVPCRLLPKCFRRSRPLAATSAHNAGPFEIVNTLLVVNLHEIEGHKASPSAGATNSQPVKTAESVEYPFGAESGIAAELQIIWEATLPTTPEEFLRRISGSFIRAPSAW